jgi:hypothetical protein
MNGLKQWSIVLLIAVIIFFVSEHDNLGKINEKSSKLDKFIASIINIIKQGWKIFAAILGIIFIIIAIVVWLGFFGIIPHGTPSPDDQPCIPNYMGSCD